MKLYIFTLLTLISITANAQFNWNKAVISLNDGTTLEGEARLISQGRGFNKTSQKVRYRGESSKEKKYDVKEVKSIIFTHEFIQEVDGMPIKKRSLDTFLPVDVKKYNGLVFMQEIVKDQLSLYGMPVKNYKSKISSDVFPMNLGEFNIIYIKKENTSARQITVLGLGGKITDKRVADYLSDCPLMLEYIRAFEGNITAVDVVNHYNNNCK
jgi:hypothetical protein